MVYLKFSKQISREEKQRNIRNRRKARKIRRRFVVFAVSPDTIASPEKSVDVTLLARKTTEKNGNSSLFPFFFRRFPATGGIARLPQPSIARELSLSVQIPFRAFREFPSVPLFLLDCFWRCALVERDPFSPRVTITYRIDDSHIGNRILERCRRRPVLRYSF